MYIQFCTHTSSKFRMLMAVYLCIAPIHVLYKVLLYYWGRILLAEKEYWLPRNNFGCWERTLVAMSSDRGRKEIVWCKKFLPNPLTVGMHIPQVKPLQMITDLFMFSLWPYTSFFWLTRDTAFICIFGSYGQHFFIYYHKYLGPWPLTVRPQDVLQHFPQLDLKSRNTHALKHILFRREPYTIVLLFHGREFPSLYYVN